MVKISFPYPSCIFKENKITEKKAFENLIKDLDEADVSKINPIFRDFHTHYYVSDGVSNFFTEKVRFDCRFSGKPSPMYVWNEIILPDLKEKKLKVKTYRELEEYIYNNYSDEYKACNTFNPYFQGFFMKEFITNNPNTTTINVLDPSMGWGDRLIGYLAIANLYPKISFTYTGFDPNVDLKSGYDTIIKKFKQKNGSVNINIKGFEESVLIENSFEYCLTSPPFFDLEIYSEDATQSVNTTTQNISYKEWLEGFYTTYLKKLNDATSNTIIIYTSNYKGYKLGDDTIRIMLSFGKFRLSSDTYTFSSEKGKNRPLQVYVRRTEGSIQEVKNTECIEFPYHYQSYGPAHKASMFNNIANVKTTFFNNDLSKAQKSYISRIKSTNNFFEKNYFHNNSTAYKTFIPGINSSDFLWKNADILLDFYNEAARVKSIGYKEEYSPYDIFNNPELLKVKGIVNRCDREELYNKITEARLAYASYSKGLMEYIQRIVKVPSNRTITILDIAAYGDRMVAATSFNNKTFKYIGIDPDVNLDYTQLIQDIMNYYPYSIPPIFFNTSLENYIGGTYSPDIVTISPPPYTAERYGSDKINEKQSYNTYKDSFGDWVEGFLTGTIIRKVKDIYKSEWLAFTALDRFDPPYEIYYTELFVLLIELCGGYAYENTLQFGLSKIPWFFFRRSKPIKDVKNKFEYMMKEYGEIVYKSKMIQSMMLENEALTHLLTDHFIKIESVEDGQISLLKMNKISYPPLSIDDIHIRKNIMLYISNILFLELRRKIPFNKIVTYLSRYIMTASSLCTPLERFMSCDVMFVNITGNNDVTGICNQQFKDNVMYNESASKSFKEGILDHILSKKTYIFEAKQGFKDRCIGLPGLIKTAGVMTYYTSLTSIDYVTHKYEYLPFSNQNIGGTSETDTVSKRYEALGAEGHHYTRPLERVRVLCKSLNEKKCIDCFATYFNSNSYDAVKESNEGIPYFSLYEDIEPASLGNFFFVKNITSGFYMANPVDTPVYTRNVGIAIKNIFGNNVYDTKHKNEITFAVGSVVWKDSKDYDWIMECYKKDDISKLFGGTTSKSKFDHPGLKEYCDISGHILGCYILNKEKYPGIDKIGGTSHGGSGERNKLNISFGVVVSNNPKKKIEKSIFGLLGDCMISQ